MRPYLYFLVCLLCLFRRKPAHQARSVKVELSPLPNENVGVPRFSFVTTILSGVIVLAYFIWLGWNQLFQPRLDQVGSPEEALPLLIGRMMELKDSLKEIPHWERSLYRVTLVDSPSDLGRAIAWYEELAANSSDPRIHVQLAILEGEAGRLNRVRERVVDWEARGASYQLFAEWIRLGYLHNPVESGSAPGLNVKLIAQLGKGWFHNRLSYGWPTTAEIAQRYWPLMRNSIRVWPESAV